MSRKALDQTLSFIKTIDRATSVAEVSDALISTVARHGFKHVLAGIIPIPGMSAEQQIANVVMHSWPDEWSRRYFSQGYLFRDPTIKRVCSSTEPFSWSEIEPSYKRETEAARVMCEARDFHLGVGFTIPMFTLDGQSAGLSLASDSAELSPEIRATVQLLGIYAFGRALNISQTPPVEQLTQRESDVLHWIAEGKSDWEIGVILNISEHTVDKMCRQIRTKLGANNRTHAVAYALRHDLIR